VRDRQADLDRLATALEAAVRIVRGFSPTALEAAVRIVRGFSPRELHVEVKGNNDPVTDVDRAVNQELLRHLVREGEGWLSEETADNPDRLGKQRVWIVDPLDGTREFVAGIPEYCISIALVEDGEAVAGGICNPATGEVFLGSRETGVTLNGAPVQPRPCAAVKDALVLASRSEVNRGEWDHCRNLPFTVQPMGSVAYKLARVAVGLADATWTFVPKHEWDIAAGVALVQAVGGTVKTLDGMGPRFNQAAALLDGLLAFSAEAAKVFDSMSPDWWKSVQGAPRKIDF
jgi:myo-inositol-1(or 4)-monophosphatase